MATIIDALLVTLGLDASGMTAGANIAGTLQTAGYYVQVLDPGAIVRGGSGSPSISFWYTDGGSVLQLNVSSTDVI